MEDRDLFLGDHHMDQVGLGMKSLSLETETLQQSMIDRKPKRAIQLIFLVALDVGVKHATKQREHVRILRS